MEELLGESHYFAKFVELPSDVWQRIQFLFHGAWREVDANGRVGRETPVNVRGAGSVLRAGRALAAHLWLASFSDT